MDMQNKLCWKEWVSESVQQSLVSLLELDLDVLLKRINSTKIEFCYNLVQQRGGSTSIQRQESRKFNK
jgi:hypothetical protein